MPEAPADAPAEGPRLRLPSARGLVGGLAFFGRVLVLAAALPGHPRRLRLTSTVHHLRETGLTAIPIVTLMAFLIGVVLAFQGAAQLTQFGAQVFVVDLIAISVLRELGVLLTAIIVAGRSGAAFTAALGSMKMREEVDALRTLGLDPIAVLALPRILALVIALPLLTVAADVAGLVGGMAMSWIELGVTPGMFLVRMEEVDASHYLAGLVKAPVFALIIGLTGCWFGFQVGSDAESLGRMTSRAVVVAIFLVIVADAAFSILFAVLGV
jgi:phospholipid/cholesterol/gamma-HCH transport system permease protein